MKKKCFLLFEILIAFFLVSICIVPLVRSPLQFYKQDLERLSLFEKARIADWVFSELKEKFLKNEIPWEEIPEKNQTTPWKKLPDASLFLVFKQKKIPCAFRMTTRGQKNTAPHQEIRQIYLDIRLEEQVYTYRVMVTLYR